MRIAWWMAVVAAASWLPRGLAESDPMEGLSLDHLAALSDERGISEFAAGVEPLKDRFCAEDTARALVAVLKVHALQPSAESARLARLYMAALAGLQEPDGAVHFGYRGDEGVMPRQADGDALARVLWGLGQASLSGIDDAMKADAARRFAAALPHFRSRDVMARAYAVQALSLFVEARPEAAEAVGALRTQTDALRADLPTEGEWCWPSDLVSYDAARVPLAFFRAAEVTGDSRYLEAGQRTLNFLRAACLPGDGGMLRPIGNDGWYPKGGEPAAYDQQPVDASGWVEACAAAWRVSNDPAAQHEGQVAFEWFLGNNSKGEPLFDAASGGCRDGLSRDGVNTNEGAESTVSYVIARAVAEEITHP